MTRLADKVLKEVNELIDPETGITYGRMGLVREVKEVENGVVHIDFSPTSPFCPIALKMALDIKRAALQINGVKEARVRVHGHAMEKAINKMVQETKLPIK